MKEKRGPGWRGYTARDSSLRFVINEEQSMALLSQPENVEHANVGFELLYLLESELYDPD